MKKVTMITGGVRSGKSRRALALCAEHEKKVFIATAEKIDDEMVTRIGKHQAERGSEWTTIEEPLDLAAGVERAVKSGAVIVVDCLTVWVANLAHHLDDPEQIESAVRRFLLALQKSPVDIVIVTNEVGGGIVPIDAATRRYRDLLGGLNQRVAAIAERVELIVCGIPLLLK